ncbi:hypothetical protein A2U01_0077884, partial [Trifolium medium]|nr:hypothetical protein [Trifolium medium]
FGLGIVVGSGRVATCLLMDARGAFWVGRFAGCGPLEEG